MGVTRSGNMQSTEYTVRLRPTEVASRRRKVQRRNRVAGIALACICAGGAVRALSAGLVIAGTGTGRAIAMGPFSNTARGGRRYPHPDWRTLRLDAGRGNVTHVLVGS